MPPLASPQCAEAEQKEAIDEIAWLKEQLAQALAQASPPEAKEPPVVTPRERPSLIPGSVALGPALLAAVPSEKAEPIPKSEQSKEHAAPCYEAGRTAVEEARERAVAEAVEEAQAAMAMQAAQHAAERRVLQQKVQVAKAAAMRRIIHRWNAVDRGGAGSAVKAWYLAVRQARAEQQQAPSTAAWHPHPHTHMLHTHAPSLPACGY